MSILKSKEPVATTTPMQAAGDKQERDVAFYLRRAFKDSKDYIILNDYSFRYNDENAQIDHLIIHRFGFLILESKSIYGEVKVNQNGEWSRSYKGDWTGIPSPIKQAELQLDLLQQMLQDNVHQYLGKIIGIQQGVGGRKWDACCVVSNSCILHRDNIPDGINELIIKSEAAADAVRAIGDRSRYKTFVSTAPSFSPKEMESVADYLLSQQRNKPATPTLQQVESDASSKQETHTISAKQMSSPAEPELFRILCKKCGESELLTGSYGKFGYYVKCETCSTNTSMKVPCARCQSKDAKVSKQKHEYWLNCDCSSPYLIFSQQELSAKN